MAAPKLTDALEGLSCPFRIVTVEQGTTSTIELEGEWDIAQCGATHDAVARALQRRAERLALDLSRLSRIDSSGIHALIDTLERCAERKTSLVIVPGPRAVQRVFELCHLTWILPFAPERSSVPTLVEGGIGARSYAPDSAGRYTEDALSLDRVVARGRPR
jgi:anti-anti-sigma factor